MALTDEQALYVEKVEALRKSLVNCHGNAARALLAHRAALQARIDVDPDMHAVVYGELDGEAGVSIAAELKATDAAADALFAAGLITLTREAVEKELTERPLPPMPGF